jgi:ligand-binding sensor domain-containing protein/serine/threonine protein kinase
MVVQRHLPQTRAACSVALLLCLTIPLASDALDRNKPVDHFHHDVWLRDQGLSQTAVGDVLQTRDGYLWLGTQEGLVRFDGARFVAFDNRNTEAFENNACVLLLEADDGALWGGTQGGLMRLQDGVFEQFHVADGLSSAVVSALAQTRNGDIWVGTRRGLNRLRDGEFTVYTTEDGLPDEYITTLLVDRQDNLWIGGRGRGLVVGSEGRLGAPPFQDELGDASISCLFEDASGVIWIGTRERGLYSYDGESLRSFIDDDVPSSRLIATIYQDGDGGLWVGTYDGRVCRLDGEGFDCVTPAKDVARRMITSIHEDREGSLWFGSSGGGLNRLRDTTVGSYTTTHSLSHQTAWVVREGKRGVWVGTEAGLNLLVDGQFVEFEGHAEVAQDNVKALYEDADGTLWIGSYGDGLRRLQDGRWKTFSSADGLADDQVFSITRDHEGALWIGTRAGLSRFAGDQFTTFTAADGLPAEHIMAMHVDRRGALWIGTTGGGIVRFTQGRFEPIEPDDGLTTNQKLVFSIHEDGDGTLWFGTNGGLLRFAGGEMRAYTVDDGLHDNMAFSILEDDQGYLWMSCNRGISRVARQAFVDYTAGVIDSIEVETFDEDAGMPSASCSGGSQPAGWRTRDGRLWFPTGAGVAVVDPGDIRSNPHPPQVHVERVLVDNEDVGAGEELVFAASIRRLDVRYTATSFVSPQRMRFRYRLEGFDDDWVDAGTQRTASFTNLSPGDYTFSVTASNADGIWSDHEATFTFHKRPYIYQTWPFYLACGLVVFACFIAFYAVRLRQLKRRQAELEQEVETRSRQLVEARHLLAEAKHLPIRFGPYTLVSILGEGGMARVYRAVLEGPMGFRKELAIKRIRTDLTRDNDSLVQSMINEARLGGQLKHPHVVDVYEFGSVADQYYIAMEYVPGWTLDALIAGASLRGAKLPIGAALDLMLQVADGLAHAHTLCSPEGRPLDLVHRDLKPSNVIVSVAGQAKIMDFGIARSSDATGQATLTDVVKGTPRFMSPEQLEDPRGIDHRSDLFSFGCILFEVLVGEPLIRGNVLAALMWQITSGEYRERLPMVDPVLPAARPILDRCLRPQRDQRYRDARRLADDLRALRREVGDPHGSKELADLLVAWARIDEVEVEHLRTRIENEKGPRTGWEVFVDALDRDVGDEPDPYVLPDRPSTDGVASEGPSQRADIEVDARDTTVLWKGDASGRGRG